MMRSLFKSESRLLWRMVSSCWNVPLDGVPDVRQMIVDTSATPRFNADFTLEFRDRPFPEEVAAGTRPALPNTIGPVVNVLVEAVTFQPLLLELMFGDSIDIKHYRQFTRLAEQTCRDIVSRAADLPEEVRRVALGCEVARVPHARVVALEGDVCFLVATAVSCFDDCDQRWNLISSKTADIDVRTFRTGDVCIDGWLRTEPVPPADHVLVTTHE